jgi:hypothetical protein
VTVLRIVGGALFAVVLAACASASPTPSASSQASVAAGAEYRATNFSLPFMVIVGALLKSPPTSDTTGLVSWDAAASDNEKVRFLIPVELWPPESTAPQPPPVAYLDYLRGLTAEGAVFSDESSIIVGGHQATLLTATTGTSLDGSLGCPVQGADRSDGCFGLQPEFSLRIAVVEDMGGGTPLLAWARTASDAPDDAFVAMFEAMLGSVQFVPGS